jgi:hypothetical protein
MDSEPRQVSAEGYWGPALPVIDLILPDDWVDRVLGTGWAVVNGHFVLDIEYGEDGRPRALRTLALVKNEEVAGIAPLERRVELADRRFRINLGRDGPTLFDSPDRERDRGTLAFSGN